MAKKIIVGIGVFLLLNFVFFYYMDVFKDVVINEKNMGPYMVVYEPRIGDFKGTLDEADKVVDRLREKGFNPERRAIIYYDYTGSTPVKEWKSEVGCLVEIAEQGRKEEIKNNFNLRLLPQGKYATAYFPYKNSLSTNIAAAKIFPELLKRKRVGTKETPILVIFDDQRITYLMSLEKKK